VASDRLGTRILLKTVAFVGGASMPPKGKTKPSRKATAQPSREAAAAPNGSQAAADVQPEDDLTSASCKVATECNAVVKTFVQGARCGTKSDAQGRVQVKQACAGPSTYTACG
jgi:hypothetical protein